MEINLMTDKYELSRQITEAVNHINQRLDQEFTMDLVRDKDKLLTFLKEVRADATDEEKLAELNQILNTYK